MERLTHRILSGMLAASLGGATACNDATAPSDPDLEILFLSSVLRHDSLVFSAQDLLLTSIDGRRVRNLTRSLASDQSPDWSPDGSRVVFVRESSQRDLYMLDADGGGLVTLTDDAEPESDPVWSPDGSRVAFARTDTYWDSVDTDIYIVYPDAGSLPWQVTSRPGDDEAPTWSPDGSRIAFTCSAGTRRDDPDHLCVVNADRSGLDTLVADTLYRPAPAWSPDGSRIAFRCPDAEYDNGDISSIRYYLCLVGVEDSAVQRFPDVELDAPQWSPDGSRILYAHAEDVWVMDPGTAEAVNLTEDFDAWSSQPDWSPDGRQVVFVGYHRWARHLYVQSATDSSGATRQLITPIEAAAPQWRPGRR
jgi:TolB protein